MFVLILFLFIASYSETLAKCNLDLTAVSPLVTTSIFDTPEHHGNTAYFEVGDTFFIKCLPGTSNENIAENGDEAFCDGDSYIRITRTGVVDKFSNFACTPTSSKLPYTIRRTGEVCDTDGTKFEVGYEILDSFNVVYTICYNEKTLTPSRIDFILSEANPDLFQNEYDMVPPKFKNDSANLFAGVDLEELFSKQNDTLGIPYYGVLYQSQLVPYDLSLYSFDKYATLDYINFVPVWDLVYSYWMSALAQATENGAENMKISIGTLGVLTDIMNDDDNTTELFLSPDSLVPIPKWLYAQVEDMYGATGTYFLHNSIYFSPDDLFVELQLKYKPCVRMSLGPVFKVFCRGFNVV